MAVIKVKISQVFPNPYQPESRLIVPDELAEKFGRSIFDIGLILTPVGRQDPSTLNGTAAPLYQLGDGWLRLAGFKWLVENGHPEFDEIPLDIRDLTDQQLADMVIEANEVRKNLTPIDKAYFYKECLARLKVTQAELAERYKITQGTLSNTIRLLDLPKVIQGDIIAQRISMTHALILVPLKDWPGLLDGLVQKVIKENMSTAALTDEVNQILNRQRKSKKVEAPASPPPAAVVTTTPPISTMKPETQAAVVEMAEKTVETLKTESKDKNLSGEPEKEKTEQSQDKKPVQTTQQEPPKLNKIPVVSKWKRKLAVEELASGVRVSLMSEKGFVVKNLIGNLETTLEQLPAIFEEANNKWEGK